MQTSSNSDQDVLNEFFAMPDSGAFSDWIPENTSYSRNLDWIPDGGSSTNAGDAVVPEKVEVEPRREVIEFTEDDLRDLGIDVDKVNVEGGDDKSSEMNINNLNVVK